MTYITIPKFKPYSKNSKLSDDDRIRLNHIAKSYGVSLSACMRNLINEKYESMAKESLVIATKDSYCSWCNTKTGINFETEKYEHMDKRIDPLCAKLREDNARLKEYLTQQEAVTND